MSTVAIQATPITVEQYERFEGYPGLRDELINGEIFLSPQPKPFHQQIAKNINRVLDAALQGQVHMAQQGTNIRFADANSMPSPDVFVVTKKDWHLACESDSYLSTPPVLVVEVLSPANRKTRVKAKIKVYLSQNVTEVWLVHPKKKTVEVIREQQRTLTQERLSLPAPLSGSVETGSFFTLD